MLQLSDDTQTPQLSAEQLGWASLLWCLIVCGAGVKGRVRSDGTGGEIVRCCRVQQYCRGWYMISTAPSCLVTGDGAKERINN